MKVNRFSVSTNGVTKVVVVVFGLLVHQAYAENDQETSFLIEELSIIGNRSPQAISDSAHNISQLNSAELQSVAAVHIQQALSRIPGVGLQRGEGQESLPSIRSAVQTGAGACGSVLILEETIPVRGAGFCNVNELFDTHFEQAQQIEVVRGASSAFYGSNALNGSVNVSLAAQGDNQLSFELGPNEYRRAKVAANTGIGRLYLSVADDGGFRDDSGYRQSKLSWRHAGEWGEWQWQAGATYTDLDQETAGFIEGENAFLSEVLSRQNLDPEAFRDTQSFRAWLKTQREFDNGHRFQSSVFVRDTDMAFLLHFLPGDPLEQNAQQGFGWQSAYTLPLSTNIELSLGFDGDLTDGSLRQTQDAPTRGSAFLQETIPVGVHYDYQVDARQLAVFAQADWALSSRWQVLAGLRLEQIDYDYDNLSLDGRTRDDGSECGFGGCRYSRPGDRSDQFTHLSPKLELSYQANEYWQFSLIAADTFRAPQATELYRLQRDQSVAELDLVQSTSFEASARYQSQNLRFAASIYTIDGDNQIIRDSDFFNRNGQGVASRGLELSLVQQLSDQWSYTLAAAFARHEYDSDLFINDRNINGNQVDTAPETTANLSIKWQPQTRLAIEADVFHVSDYFLEPNNDFSYQGHTLLNLRASYQLSDAWRTQLRLLNAADRRYAERADFTNFTQQRYFPGQPRRVFAEVSYRF